MPKKSVTKKIHLIASILATLTIATFFVSTVIVELLYSHSAIAMVKSLIVIPGLFILIPLIMAATGTGFSIGKKRKGKLVAAKKKRMPFIVINGAIILTPCAIYLDYLASSGIFNTSFYIVQGIELLSGAVNITLMGLNIRDGFKMSRRFSSK